MMYRELLGRMEICEEILGAWCRDRSTWSKYMDMVNILMSSGWQHHNDTWLDRPSETDPSHLIRISLGLGNVVLIHGKYGISSAGHADRVYGELLENVEEIEDAISQANKIERGVA